MTEKIRYKSLYEEWKKIQTLRDRMRILKDQNRKLSKEIKEIAQKLPKMMDRYNELI